MTFPSNTPMRTAPFKGAETQSIYIPMRDGTRLAVDVSLPRGLAGSSTPRIPALLACTRYWRAQQVRQPFSRFITLPDSARDFFCAYGYAILRVDMRGTGASEGNQRHPWPASDLDDLYDLAEWITLQAWSSGQVSAFGNSYQATTAEMLGACGHPAVTTALVRFNEYDVYTDIAFPGGVPNEFILREWAEFNRALDANQLPKRMSAFEKFLICGVKPVKGVIPTHQNQQVDSALEHITYRDDLDPQMGVTIDQISMHTRPTTHIVDHWGSWFDAATADAVIRRFANQPGPQRAVIGAWNHGATQQVGMPKNPFPLLAQMQESLRFFDQPPHTRELHYYTINENKWKTTPDWPPAGLAPTRFYFHERNGLSNKPPETCGSDQFTVDYSASTGLNNRWQTELDQRPVKYRAQKNLLAYCTAALDADMEITGYPLIHLFVKSTHADGVLFVYLEALDEHGTIQYLTEGMLRVIHRKISDNPPAYKQFVPYHSFKRADSLPLVPGESAELAFGLNPISALVPRGWRLRISIAGADRQTFLRLPATGTPDINILFGGENASYIEIPTK